MKIKVWCDTQCPYGLLAANNLMQAMSSFEHIDKIDLEYKSFILPQCDTSGEVNWVKNAAAIFSLPEERAAITLEEIQEKTRSAGIEVDFMAAKVASSRPSHRMIQYLKQRDTAEGRFGVNSLTPRWATVVLQLAFQSQHDISDEGVLVDAAVGMGIDADTARQVINDTSFDSLIDEDIADGRELNIRRLPYFVIGNDASFAGPQSVDTFREALAQAYASE